MTSHSSFGADLLKAAEIGREINRSQINDNPKEFDETIRTQFYSLLEAIHLDGQPLEFYQMHISQINDLISKYGFHLCPALVPHLDRILVFLTQPPLFLLVLKLINLAIAESSDCYITFLCDNETTIASLTQLLQEPFSDVCFISILMTFITVLSPRPIFEPYDESVYHYEIIHIALQNHIIDILAPRLGHFTPDDYQISLLIIRIFSLMINQSDPTDLLQDEMTNCAMQLTPYFFQIIGCGIPDLIEYALNGIHALLFTKIPNIEATIMNDDSLMSTISGFLAAAHPSLMQGVFTLVRGIIPSGDEGLQCLLQRGFYDQFLSLLHDPNSTDSTVSSIILILDESICFAEAARNAVCQILLHINFPVVCDCHPYTIQESCINLICSALNVVEDANITMGLMAPPIMELLIQSFENGNAEVLKSIVNGLSGCQPFPDFVASIVNTWNDNDFCMGVCPNLDLDQYTPDAAG